MATKVSSSSVPLSASTSASEKRDDQQAPKDINDLPLEAIANIIKCLPLSNETFFTLNLINQCRNAIRLTPKGVGFRVEIDSVDKYEGEAIPEHPEFLLGYINQFAHATVFGKANMLNVKVLCISCFVDQDHFRRMSSSTKQDLLRFIGGALSPIDAQLLDCLPLADVGSGCHDLSLVIDETITSLNGLQNMSHLKSLQIINTALTLVDVVAEILRVGKLPNLVELLIRPNLESQEFFQISQNCPSLKKFGYVDMVNDENFFVACEGLVKTTNDPTLTKLTCVHLSYKTMRLYNLRTISNDLHRAFPKVEHLVIHLEMYRLNNSFVKWFSTKKSETYIALFTTLEERNANLSKVAFKWDNKYLDDEDDDDMADDCEKYMLMEDVFEEFFVDRRMKVLFQD
ncbi:hypothetical protein HDU76_004338 [Blyttiomyces sp. JEL0837]|nr:hypothetical protein HDU76_004338 [Blyttiomyces sp. JEL0837]